jgi:DNA polymerase-3 subunit delta'
MVEPGENVSIKIEQVRDIIERVAYRPFEGRRRVVIIDDADALVPAAQNALLKTLEEPPPGSVLMLVTTRPDVLLPTVRSRCPQLRFSSLAASDIAATLVARGSSESQARAVAATADGSLGHALAVVKEGAGDLIEARDVAHQVLERASSISIPSRRIEGAKAIWADREKKNAAVERAQVATRLRATAALLRDIVALGVGADDRSLANTDMRSALERLVPAYQGERGVRAFAAIDRALAAVKSNVSVKLVADWLVLQL